MNKPKPKSLSVRELGQMMLYGRITPPAEPNPGMPAPEIRMRLQLAGLSIPELARKMRRSPHFVLSVLERQQRSHAVQKTIGLILGSQGYTYTDIWGEDVLPGMPDAAEPSEALPPNEVEGS